MNNQFELLFDISPVNLTEESSYGLIMLVRENQPNHLSDYLSTTNIDILPQLIEILNIDPMFIKHLLYPIAVHAFTTDIIDRLLLTNYQFPDHGGDIPPYSMINYMLQVVVQMINIGHDYNRVSNILNTLTVDSYDEKMYRYYLRTSIDLSNVIAVEWMFNDLKKFLSQSHIRKTIYSQWSSRVRGALERFTLEFDINTLDLIQHIKGDEILNGSDIYPRDATYQEIVQFVRIVLDWKVYESAQSLYQSFQRRRYNHLVTMIGDVLTDLGEDYTPADEDL